MKKNLRLTLVALLTLFCGNVLAQDVVLDFTTNEWGLPEGSKNKETAEKEFTNGTYTIKLSASDGYYFNNTTNFLMLGKTNSTLTLPKFDFAVSKIEVVGTSGASASVKQNIFVDDVAVSQETTGAKDVTNTYSIDANYQAAGTVYVFKVLSSHNTQISTIKVYKASATSKKDAGLKFSESEVSVVLGETFTAPTLTKETDGNVTYTSGDTEVATVDKTSGEVTIVGVGSTKIIATAEETDTYNSGSASYTLTVTQPVYGEVTLPYTESFKDGIGSFTINDVNLSDGLSYVWKHDANYGYMKASAYVGSNKAAESWLVSPVINLENVTDATLKFYQTINKYFGNIENEATLWIMAEGGEWEQITITYPELPESGNWSDAEEQVIDLKDYVGKKIQVGFKYVSTTEAAGTWEIEDFSVTGTASGIESVTVEPEFNENAPVYNLAGQRVSKDTKGILIQNGKKFINR